MSLRIYQNIDALNAHRQLSVNQGNLSKSIERLSSGLRINRAGDDAAGLAISEKMRGQVRGLKQATRNAQDGISMIQTAEGALNETHSILQRMRELAVQASNDTNTPNEREEIQKELNQLTSELNRIGNTTEFNTQKLLNGNKAGASSIGGEAIAASASSAQTVGTSGNIAITDGTAYSGTANATWTLTTDGTDFTLDKGDGNGPQAVTFSTDTLTVDGVELDKSSVTAAAGDTWTITVTAEGTTEAKDGIATLQIGANEGQAFKVEILDMRAQQLGLSGAGVGFSTGEKLTDVSIEGKDEFALDLSSATAATSAITTIDGAIEAVSAERSKLGSYQNRLEHTIQNLGTAAENLSAAESRIRDVDMASEMMDFTKNQILQQAGVAMLAQANQAPQAVLQLLR